MAPTSEHPSDANMGPSDILNTTGVALLGKVEPAMIVGLLIHNQFQYLSMPQTELEWDVDCDIAFAYFELVETSHVYEPPTAQGERTVIIVIDGSPGFPRIIDSATGRRHRIDHLANPGNPATDSATLIGEDDIVLDTELELGSVVVYNSVKTPVYPGVGICGVGVVITY
ncbi:MAG: hypothetical protein Q9163_004122 [Psora crenata]